MAKELNPCKICGCTKIGRTEKPDILTSLTWAYRECEDCGHTTTILVASEKQGDAYWNERNPKEEAK